MASPQPGYALAGHAPAQPGYTPAQPGYALPLHFTTLNTTQQGDVNCILIHINPLVNGYYLSLVKVAALFCTVINTRSVVWCECMSFISEGQSACMRMHGEKHLRGLPLNNRDDDLTQRLLHAPTTIHAYAWTHAM